MKQPTLKNPFGNRDGSGEPSDNASSGGDAPWPRPAGRGISDISGRWITLRFLLALGAAISSIVICYALKLSMFWTIAWPTIIVGLYIFSTLSMALNAPSIRDQISDSWYYLCFLCTLCALVVSMIDFTNSGGQPRQSDLIARIGLSLVASIIGLAARQVLNLLTLTPDEASDRAQESVLDQANILKRSMAEVHSSLRQQTNEFRDALKENVGEIKDFSKAVSGDVKKTHDAHAKALNRLAEANAKAIEDAAKKFEAGVDRILAKADEKIVKFEIFPENAKERFEKPLNDIVNSMSRLGESINSASEMNKKYGETFEQVRAALAKLSEHLTGYSESVSDLAALRAAVTGTTASLGFLNTSLDQVAASICGTEPDTTGITQKLNEEFSQLSELRQKISREVENVIALNAQVLSKLKESLQSYATIPDIANVASGLNEQFEQISGLRAKAAEEVDAIIGMNEKVVTKLSGSLEALATVMDSVSNRGSDRPSFGSNVEN